MVAVHRFEKVWTQLSTWKTTTSELISPVLPQYLVILFTTCLTLWSFTCKRVLPMLKVMPFPKGSLRKRPHHFLNIYTPPNCSSFFWVLPNLASFFPKKSLLKIYMDHNYILTLWHASKSAINAWLKAFSYKSMVSESLPDHLDHCWLCSTCVLAIVEHVGSIENFIYTHIMVIRKSLIVHFLFLKYIHSHMHHKNFPKRVTLGKKDKLLT